MKKTYIIPQSEVIALEAAQQMLAASTFDSEANSQSITPSIDSYSGEFNAKHNTNPVNWDE